jgi:hypothetical protein
MKTFLEFVESQKRLPCIDTIFGSHSLPKQVNETYIPEVKGARHMDHEQQIEKMKRSEADPIHGDNRPNTEHPELEAAKAYTNESTLINGYLKTKYKGEEDVKPHHFNIHSSDIAKLDDFVGSHETPRDIHVFSGVTKSPLKYFPDANPHEKFIGHLPHFTSTSTNFGQAKEFTSLDNDSHPPENLANANQGVYPGDKVGHVLKIEVPKGTKAVSMRDISKHPNEDEILLHRGHNLEIHPHPTFDPGSNVFVWHSKIVGHNPQEIPE